MSSTPPLGRAESEVPPIRLGMIGYGAISKVQLDVLRGGGQRDVRVVAVADPVSEDALGGLPLHRDHRDLLAREDINAVAVNTPPWLHFQIGKDALRAGKDVLLEKPPTLEVAELEVLSRLAADNGLCLFTSYHARYSPPVLAAQRMLASQTVTTVDVLYRECVYDYHSPDGWVFKRREAGGGVLMDSGVNALSVISAITPSLRNYNIGRVELNRLAHLDVETSADVSFYFGEGATGRLRMDWLHEAPETRSITITTTDHEYVIDLVQAALYEDGIAVVSRNAGSPAVDQHAEYRGVYADFVQHSFRRHSFVSTTELAFVTDCYARTGEVATSAVEPTVSTPWHDERLRT